MMKKVVIVLCVIAMSSIAIADMTEDFESMVTSDLDPAVSSGPFLSGYPNYYDPPHVYIDTDGVGTNTTQVVDIGGFSSLEHQFGAEKRPQGTYSFDINFDDNQYGSLAVRSDMLYSYEIFRVNFNLGYGDPTKVDLTDAWGAGGTMADVATPGTWAHFELAFDNSTELWSLSVDSNPIWTNHAGYDPAKAGLFGVTNAADSRLYLTGGGSGDHMYIDNVFIPEPATCLLLGSGLVLLRRRKRA